MMATADYVKTIEEVRSTVLDYVSQQWTVLKKSNGVEVSSNQFPDIPGKIYKAVGEVDAPISEVFEYTAPACRENWDKSVKTLDIVENLDEKTYVLHSVAHGAAMGLIAPRDFVDLVREERDYNGGLYFSCAVGIEYPVPEDPSLVRGWNYPSGILCYPLEGDRTRVAYLVHTDLKGMLPVMLIESTVPWVQCTFFANLRKAVQQSLMNK